MTFVRSILKSDSAEDVRSSDELVKRVKIYPLSNSKNPPTQKFDDMTDIVYDGLIRYHESLYTNLARILNEEPVPPRDLEMMGMLLPLGIEEGKEFKPNATTLSQLKEAAGEAHNWLGESLAKFVTEWGPGSQWYVPGPPIAQRQNFIGRPRTTSTSTRVQSRYLRSSRRQRNSVRGASTWAPTMTAAARICVARMSID